MEILRKLRWVLYPSVFGLVFIFSAYLLFPKQVLRDFTETSLTFAAMGIGPRSKGVPKVSIRDVSLWRLSGIQLENLQIVWPQGARDQPPVLDIDSLRGRLGLWSMLLGTKSLTANSELYAGSLSADLSMNKKNQVRNFNAQGANINLGQMTFLHAILGAPLQGVLRFSTQGRAQTELTKDGSASFTVMVSDASYGPGSINFPAGGFVSSMSVPKISLGKLVLEFELKEGTLSSQKISLSGGDLQAEIDLSVTLGRAATSSRVMGSGWFSLNSELVNTTDTLKMLYDLIPELKNARQSNGKVGVLIRGNVARPNVRLNRYQDDNKTQKNSGDAG